MTFHNSLAIAILLQALAFFKEEIVRRKERYWWSGGQVCYYGTMEKQNTNSEAQELSATVRGEVQGVGFRYFVVERALSLGLRGYARNLSDGGVEVLAQGPRPALESLLALLRRGPAAAEVTEVEVQWNKPSTSVSGFHVRW